MNLSNKDHSKMDTSIDTVLNSYKEGEISLLNARGLIAHVITARVKGNDAEITSFLDEEYMKRWKDSCQNG